MNAYQEGFVTAFVKAAAAKAQKGFISPLWRKGVGKGSAPLSHEEMLEAAKDVGLRREARRAAKQEAQKAS